MLKGAVGKRRSCEKALENGKCMCRFISEKWVGYHFGANVVALKLAKESPPPAQSEVRLSQPLGIPCILMGRFWCQQGWPSKKKPKKILFTDTLD